MTCFHIITGKSLASCFMITSFPVLWVAYMGTWECASGLWTDNSIHQWRCYKQSQQPLVGQDSTRVTWEEPGKFAGLLIYGLVSLAVVWLGHTYFQSSQWPYVLCVSAKSCTNGTWICATDISPLYMVSLQCGPISWYASSLDLNPGLLWGDLKEYIYRDQLSSVEALVA
jgi:hypothetical protein